MATVTMSGLGVKLSSGIQVWSGGILFVGLVIIAVVCVIMGFGGPSLTAYFIVSMFATPALMKMGIGFEQSHFFTMFFAVFAFLTPPVALVALIAAKLAEAPYIPSAIEATKAAIGGFIIPFMFIYSPILLLQPQEPFEAALAVVASVTCLFALEVGFVGYYLTDCTFGQRLLAAAAGLSLFIFFILNSHILFLVGISLCMLLTILQWRQKSMLGVKALPELRQT
jgi:TRAP-type uncharacterized transport system fused permease subunit